MKQTKAVSVYPLPPGPELMDITPDMAADWLENRSFAGNRKTSKAKAEQLAAAMKAGRFLETHQGIAFDTEGLQIDGRHRLTAVVLANVTVRMWVFPDQTRDTFDVIDTGYARAASQFLPSVAPALAAGAVRYISAATDPEHSGIYRHKMPLHDVLALHRQWPEVETWALATFGARSVAAIPPSPLLAIVAMGDRGGARPDVIQEFLDGLKSGAIGDAHDPRLILRNRFIKDHKNLAGSRNRNHVFALIVKAFNHYVADERPKRIIWSDGDHIPLPLGITWGGKRLSPPGSEAA
ncbi:hypothetical protein [Streptomyces rochei]|uniref:hypothetical protein n=1 Tax=Streptomyces rochei TaxID=1928 RepID=UPI0036FC1478